jgi:hypothetical protein
MSTSSASSSPCAHGYYAGCPVCHPCTSVTITPPYTTGGMFCLLCGAWSAHGTQHVCPKTVATPPTFTYVAMGWECPRCHAIHAPSVTSCWCPAPSTFSIGTGPDAPTITITPAVPDPAQLEIPDTSDTSLPSEESR